MKSLFLAAGVFLLFQMQIQAETQVRYLSWTEVVQLAQKNNLELRAAEQQYLVTKELEKTAYSGFLPQITANARGTHAGDGSSSTHHYGADLSLTQNLFAGFSDFAQYNLKKLNSQQAAIELQITKAKLSQELKQLFAEAYFAQASIKLSEDILRRRQDNLRSVKLQYEVGRENKGSMLLSDSNVEQAQFDLMKARHESETTLDSFRRYLGLSVEDSISIKENISVEINNVASLDFDKLTEEHIQIQKARNEESLARSTLNVTRATFLPSLDFNARYGYSDEVFFPKQDDWSLGLTLSVPLFNGLRDFAAYHSNAAKLGVAEAQLKNTRLSLKRDLKRAYYDSIEAVQKEKVDQGFIKATQIRADIARNKYKNGLLSFEEWDRIENELIQKQREILTSEKNRITRQALWEKALATGVLK